MTKTQWWHIVLLVVGPLLGVFGLYHVETRGAPLIALGLFMAPAASLAMWAGDRLFEKNYPNG